MTPEERAAADELCRLVGLRLLKTVRICDWMGWQNPSGALPYLHGKAEDALLFEDFVRWACTGDREARQRLSESASRTDIASIPTPRGEQIAATLAALLTRAS